ncbi:MAG: hypothetical protein WCE51_01390, partial [Chthoniobacterales bacterium]
MRKREFPLSCFFVHASQEVAPALATSELTHRYGERVALDHVSLQVASREIFGLLGPNGGGKTTL